MTTIVTRAGKGSPLTHTEVDTNFTNLNTNKLETAAIPLGTLAAPSISFVGDANTGAYSPGADTLAFVTAGSNRVHITSGGLVGIGTSLPDVALHVVGNAILTGAVSVGTTASATSLQFPAVTGWGPRIQQGGASINDFGIFTNNTEHLTVKNSGNVGIGNTGPSQKLHITDSSAAFTRYESGSFDAYVGQRSTGILEIAQAQAGNITFLNNGSERARIDSSGRLLVGTSSAFGGSKTEINSGTDTSAIRITDANYDGSGSTFLYPVAAYYARTQGSVRSANPLATGGATAAIVFTDEPGNATYVENLRSSSIRFYTGANSVPSFANVTPTERMRIDSSGFVVAGGTSNNNSRIAANISGVLNGIASRTTAAAGTGYSHFSASVDINGSLADVFYVFGNGNVQNTNNSYGAISDAKLKENIVDATSQWADVKAFRVRKYNFKKGQTHTQIGLVAQEVELVSPGLVNESPDRDAEGNDLGTVTKSVNYSVLYMKAVKALQEAMERIETLEQRLTAAGID